MFYTEMRSRAMPSWSSFGIHKEKPDCEREKPKGLEVKVGETIYEIEFGQIQIEITGKCNMNCQHCRAACQPNEDMPIGQVIKIIQFARRFSPDYKEVILSGGEPLMHAYFSHLLERVRSTGGKFITLTTNGSFLKKDHLDLIKSLAFDRFTLSVSLDSLVPEKHDEFRRHRGAYVEAVSALKLIATYDIPNLIPSMRSTLQASQICEMQDMVAFAQDIGCKRVGFSAIHPSGRARERKDLWMTREQKRDFIQEIYRLKGVFPEMNITTSDPLKCLFRGSSEIGGEGELVFDGCGAAAITFNVNSDGTMTPCALLNLPMMNVFPLTIEQIAEEYRSNEIVRNMLAMNLNGKCGACSKKYQCGGCRARALMEGDYLGEDPHCWLA